MMEWTSLLSLKRSPQAYTSSAETYSALAEVDVPLLAADSPAHLDEAADTPDPAGGMARREE